MIKFDDKTDSKRAKERKVGLASQDPALITDKTNETKKKQADNLKQQTNKTKNEREIVA